MIACCTTSHPLETGGILVGRYTPDRDCANIVAASGPPRDSQQGPTWFIRGTRHLQRWLSLRWKKHQEHYLGEWHYHPSSRSSPSGQDREQLRKIAKNKKTRCPEPLLVIIGGDACEGFSLSCFVSPAGRPLLPMFPESVRLSSIKAD